MGTPAYGHRACACVNSHVMSRELEQALADEIVAEVARQRYTATEMQRRTGIKSRTWQNYMVQRTRPIPLTVVYDVAAVLGLTGSELMARAEARVAGGDVHARRAEQLLSQMSPEAAESLRRYLAGRASSDTEEGDSPGVLSDGTNGRFSAVDH